jgi:hypothetical protein
MMREAGREEKTVTLITSRDKTVAVTVQTRTAATPEHAFKVNVPIDLSLVFIPCCARSGKPNWSMGPRRRLSESASFG